MGGTIKVLKRLIIGSLIGALLGLACGQAMIWIYANITYDAILGVLIAAPLTGSMLFIFFGYLNDQEKDRRNS